MVQSRYARGAVKGMLKVRSRYTCSRGAVEVCLCASGTLTDVVPVLSFTLTFYLAVYTVIVGGASEFIWIIEVWITEDLLQIIMQCI